MVVAVTGIWLVAFVLQWILLLVLLVTLAGFLRYFATIEERLDQSVPRITKFQSGDSIGSFQLPNARGGDFIFASDTGSRILMLLLSPSCSSCEVAARQVAELANRARPIGWAMVLVTHGTPQIVNDFVARALEGTRLQMPDSVTLVADEEGQLLREYMAASVPVGLAIDEHGHLLDQTTRPVPNWVYLTLGVAGPSEGLLPASWIGHLGQPLDTHAVHGGHNH
jgi:hypothetical protein